MPIETEIKLRLDSAAAARRLLKNAGFEVATKRHFETNEILDTADATLRQRGELLRIRQAAGQTVITFKGPAQAAAKHKSREELEFSTHEKSAKALFESLGYATKFRYEKYRTIYHRAKEKGHAVLDETPIGIFLELEGTPRWIDRVARQLGFAESDYILASYGALWAQHSGGHGDFVFPRTKSASRPSTKDLAKKK